MTIKSVYTTAQGDTWDSIAYEQLGDEYYIDELFKANPRLLSYLVFPEGIDVNIPDLNEETTQAVESIISNAPDDTESDDDSSYDEDIGDVTEGEIDNI